MAVGSAHTGLDDLTVAKSESSEACLLVGFSRTRVDRSCLQVGRTECTLI